MKICKVVHIGGLKIHQKDPSNDNPYQGIWNVVKELSQNSKFILFESGLIKRENRNNTPEVIAPVLLFGEGFYFTIFHKDHWKRKEGWFVPVG